MQSRTIHVDTPEEAREVVRACLPMFNKGPTLVAHDYETMNAHTHLPSKESRSAECVPLLGSFAFPLDDQTVFGVSYENVPELLPVFSALLAHPNACLIGHNEAFDRRVALRYAQIAPCHADTLHLAYLCNLEDGEGHVDLKTAIHSLRCETAYEHPGDFESVWCPNLAFTKTGKPKKAAFLPMSEILRDEGHGPVCRKYAVMDSVCTVELYLNAYVRLEKYNLLSYYFDTFQPFCDLLERMEDGGIRIDVRHCTDAIRKCEMSDQRVQFAIDALLGPTNARSSKQLRTVFFGDAETNTPHRCGCPVAHKPLYEGNTGPSVNAHTLKKYAQAGCVAAKLMQESKTDKRAFFERFLEGAEPEQTPEGKTVYVGHTSWHPFLRSGRISGRKNERGLCGTLQNVPRSDDKDFYKVRKTFIARPGHALVVADYSQIELRLLAHFSKDAVMTQAFLDNVDLHARTAVKMFNLDCPEQDVKKRYKAERTKAKSINFGIPYGLTALGLQANLDKEGVVVTVEEAQALIDQWLSTFSGVAAWLAQTLKDARRVGYAQTILGKRRYLPDLRITPIRAANMPESKELRSQQFSRLKHAENCAVNTPIQGSAGDVIQLAQVALDADARLNEIGFTQRLQVHDEIVAEAPIRYADEALARMIEIMTSVVTLDVPVLVEGDVGFSWYDCK